MQDVYAGQRDDDEDVGATDTSGSEAGDDARAATGAAKRDRVLRQRFRLRIRKLVDKTAEIGGIPPQSSLLETESV